MNRYAIVFIFMIMGVCAPVNAQQQPISPNDTLVTYNKKPLNGLVEVVGINAAVLSWDYFLFDRHWAKVTNKSIKENFTDGWVWDDDSFSGNQFSHPFHGSLFFNSARENGMSYVQSMLYPILGSWMWEEVCENNRPAINDLFATGIGGSAIGEVTHRASDLVFDDSKTGANRVLREIAGSILNPVRGVNRLFKGEMFRVNHESRGKRIEAYPFEFEVGIGSRWIGEITTHPEYGKRYFENLPVIDFSLDYGDPFNAIDGGKTTPFDKFEVSATLNLKGNNPTFGFLDISGRILSRQHSLKHNWSVDWGLYQNFKYVDHYHKDGAIRPGSLPLISEAASFGGGVYVEHEGKNKISNLFMLSAVPMGGSASDYYGSDKLMGLDAETKEGLTQRRYNYGIGFSIRENIKANIGSRITIGNKFYFLQLYTLNGYNPKAFVEHHNNVMGDKGRQSILMNTLYTKIQIAHNVNLRMEYQRYHRKGVWDYYPETKNKSHQVKTTLSYSI